jgi:hypothetical protein
VYRLGKKQAGNRRQGSFSCHVAQDANSNISVARTAKQTVRRQARIAQTADLANVQIADKARLSTVMTKLADGHW